MIIFEDNLKTIKNIYAKLADNLKSSYDIMTRKQSFSMAKNDVLVSFDHYFQAIIVLSILHEKKIKEGQINDISSIVRYSDLVKNYLIDREDKLDDTALAILEEEAGAAVKSFPAFFTMAILIDKEIENTPGSSTTLVSLLYSKLKEVIKLTNDTPKLHQTVLKDTIDFFVMNHIPYN